MGHTKLIKVGLILCLLAGQIAFGFTKLNTGGPVAKAGENSLLPGDFNAYCDTPTLAGGRQTYLALGDSYTIGESVTAQERYPVQAARVLAAGGDTIDAPEIIATTGWTTADLLGALRAHPPTRNLYSRVTLLIGVNNQYQRRSLSEYQQQFTELLKEAIHWAGDSIQHVIVLSIPDYGDSFYGQKMQDPASISVAIDSFNTVNQQISAQFGVKYVNITDLTRQAKGDSTLFAADGLHYSGKEMALWAALLVKAW